MDFEKVLSYAAKNNISDIHVSPGLPVSFRLHGELESVGEKTTHNEIHMISLEILNQTDQERLDIDRSVDFAYTSKEGHRFRGNFFYTRKGLVLALRLIPETIPDFDTLGLPRFVLDNILALKDGLILLVGPTGHGKSTTLASCIKHRAAEKSEHIITFEDPIEFLIESDQSLVHQRALGRDVMKFSDGLKSALREDPDVLLVGEMRDLETISAALTAAETGHLVLSTLHTSDAGETVNRIIDAFPTGQQAQIRAQLATTLKMVVAQKLLPAADESGRVLAYETMVTTYAIKNHIRKGTTYQIPNSMQTDNTGQMILFDESLAKLVMDGKITLETAFINAVSQDQIQQTLELHGYDLNNANLEMASRLSS